MSSTRLEPCLKQMLFGHELIDFHEEELCKVLRSAGMVDIWCLDLTIDLYAR